MSKPNMHVGRRQFLKGVAASAGTLMTAALLEGCGPLQAPGAGGQPVKIGVLLPYSDIYAALGKSITDGMELYFEQNGGSAGGRKLTLIKEDEGTAVLTSLPVVGSSTTHLPYADSYHSARALVRLAVSVNGRTLQIFGTHLQPGNMSARYSSITVTA